MSHSLDPFTIKDTFDKYHWWSYYRDCTVTFKTGCSNIRDDTRQKSIMSSSHVYKWEKHSSRNFIYIAIGDHKVSQVTSQKSSAENKMSWCILLLPLPILHNTIRNCAIPLDIAQSHSQYEKWRITPKTLFGKQYNWFWGIVK